MVNSKKKGNAFENKIYKILRDSGRFEEVKKTLGSGSSDEKGDIIGYTDGALYMIECKKGKKYTDKMLRKIYERLFDSILERKSDKFEWDNLYTDIYAVIIYQQHRAGIYCILPFIRYRNQKEIIARITLQDFIEKYVYWKMDELLEYVKKNPGLKFKHLLARLEINEATLNKNLQSLLKHKLIRKSEDKRYFAKWHTPKINSAKAVGFKLWTRAKQNQYGKIMGKVA